MSTQVAPNKQELEGLLGQGLTQKQIAEAWGERIGQPVSRSTIAMAIDRYGLKSARPRPRYEDTLPWEVRVEHATMRDARMLRLEGRRRRRSPLTATQKRQLKNWKDALDAVDAVIHYLPESARGFHWVCRDELDARGEYIRRPEVAAAIRKRDRERKKG